MSRWIERLREIHSRREAGEDERLDDLAGRIMRTNTSGIRGDQFRAPCEPCLKAKKGAGRGERL